MKKCPLCAEEILEDAIKCRYCGEFLNTAKNSTEIKNPKMGKDKMVLGSIIFLLGLIFSVSSCTSGHEIIAIPFYITTVIGTVIYLIGHFENWYHWK